MAELVDDVLLESMKMDCIGGSDAYAYLPKKGTMHS